MTITETNELVKISDSQTASYLTCKRKHYYSHGLGLKSKSTSDSLSRGILGHESLATFYQALLDGKSKEVATQEALNVLTHALLEGTADAKIVGSLTSLVSDYLRYYDNDHWTIVAVESVLTAPLNNEIAFDGRLDLLVYVSDVAPGPYAGSYIVVDHKFVYDFATENAIMMNSQLAKYAAALKFQGIDVKYQVLNELRWRERKSAPYTNAEKFRRTYLPVNPKQQLSLMEEQLIVGEEIFSLRNGTIQEWSRKAVRTLNSLVCNNCPFIQLCKLDQIGGNVDLMIQTEFDYKDA